MRRREFVDAGVRLLEGGHQAGALDADALAAAGAPAQAVFAESFRSREDYLFEVWTELLDRVRQEVVAAIQDRPMGVGRMREGIEALLDAALRRRSVYELSVTLRSDPRQPGAVEHRNRAVLALLFLELQRVGVPKAEELAMLIRDKVAGIAQAEFSTGEALPALRDDFYGLLEGLQP